MTWHGFNLVDVAVLAILIGGVVGGVRRGLSGELARVLVAAGCITVVFKYTRRFAEWLSERYNGEAYISLLGSLAILLLGSYIVLTVLRLALSAILNFTFKGRLERIGGAVCGLLRSAMVAALLLLLFSLLPNDSLHRMTTEDSFAGRLVTAHVQPWYEKLAEKVPELRLPEKTSDEWKEDASEKAAELWEEVPLGPVE